MKQIRIPGRIQAREFIPKNQRNFDNAMTVFDGKEVVLIVAKKTNERTRPQNNYLWSVPYKMIADETGSDQESVHHEMANMFLREHGGTIPKVKSTTKLSTIEFNEYIDNVIRWAASFLELYVPLPNEKEMWGDV